MIVEWPFAIIQSNRNTCFHLLLIGGSHASFPGIYGIPLSFTGPLAIMRGSALTMVKNAYH